MTKDIGKALEASTSSNICIGITSWGCLYGKEKLLQKADDEEEELGGVGVRVHKIPPRVSARSDFLASGHSHFILVDDRSDGKCKKEMEFRTNFEEYVRSRRNGNIIVYNSIFTSN